MKNWCCYITGEEAQKLYNMGGEMREFIIKHVPENELKIFNLKEFIDKLFEKYSKFEGELTKKQITLMVLQNTANELNDRNLRCSDKHYAIVKIFHNCPYKQSNKNYIIQISPNSKECFSYIDHVKDTNYIGVPYFSTISDMKNTIKIIFDYYKEYYYSLDDNI